LSEPESARLVFGPGGVLALTSLSDGVQLWNVEAGQLLYTLIRREGRDNGPEGMLNKEQASKSDLCQRCTQEAKPASPL
jgi:hypothetical protein